VKVTARHVPGADLAGERAVGDAVGDRAGLAGARRRPGCRPAGGSGHRRPLLGVEPRQHRISPHEESWHPGLTLCGKAECHVTQPKGSLTDVDHVFASWCGYCHRLKSQLDREGIAYDVVDIERNPEAARFVMSVNRGNQTVPTVQFPDGTALTNPSIVQVKQHLSTIAA
jgi:mycoredoxin